MRLSLGSLLFLLTALFSPAAMADEPAALEPAALSWVRAESADSCPSVEDVTRAIDRRLGHAALVAKERAKLVIDAQLEGLVAGGFRIALTLKRGQEVVGRRELESAEASCQGVAETAALVIALAIDPEASLEPLPIPTTKAVAPRSSSEVPRSRPALQRPTSLAPAAPVTELLWQGDLELGGTIATGSVPGVAAGAHARGRALPPALPFAIELEGGYFPKRRIEALPGKGADFSAFHLGAALCSRPNRARRLAASLCAVALVGALAGQGYGFRITPKFRTWTFAIGARGALWFRLLEPLAVVVGPSIAIPLKRDYFETTTVNGTESLFRMSQVGLGFDLGLVWEL